MTSQIVLKEIDKYIVVDTDDEKSEDFEHVKVPDVEKILRSVDGKINNLTKEKLEILKEYGPLVTTISLSGMDFSESKNVKSILSCLQNVEVLDLKESYISMASFEELAKCTKIQELNISALKIYVGAIVKKLASLKNMKILQFSAHARLTDDELITVVQGMPNLEELCLKGCLSLTKAIIPKLASCKKLKILDVRECDGLQSSYCDYKLLSHVQLIFSDQKEAEIVETNEEFD